MIPSLKNRSQTIKLIGVGLIFLFFLGAFEFASYFFVTNEWVIQSTSELSSTRWYLRWLNQMKRKEIEQVTSYGIDEHHPYLGWSPKKNSRTVMYDDTIVSFNSVGIRGLKEYRFEKPSDWKRIAVIGDSFTFGEEVNDSETYSALLEKKLTKTEVMNFGVHGYGIDQMLLRFEQKVLSYKPDIVVFAFVYDDINRGFVSFRDYQKPLLHLTDDGQLQLTNTPIPEPQRLLNKARFESKTVLAAQLLFERWKFQDYDNVPTEAFFNAVFERVYSQAKVQQSIPVFLFLPSGEEMIDATSEFLAGEKILFDFCQNTTAVCLSARPYLIDASKAGAGYDTSRHYTAKTHQIITDGLLKDLTKHKVLTNAQ